MHGAPNPNRQPEYGRTDRIARAYAAALAAARAARETGDDDGARYARREASRLARALGV
jgi:hypothetical protein